MIDFNDVRRTQEQTFFFFPDGYWEEFEHFLCAAGIPEQDARILDYEQTRETYPDLDIPSVSKLPGRKTNVHPMLMCKKPLLLVSYMDVDDLERKFWAIHGSPEAKAWRAERTRRLVEAMEREANEMDTRDRPLPAFLLEEDEED